MKHINGTGMHHESRRRAQFSAEYRISLSGISYSGSITLDGCRPAAFRGHMSWTPGTIWPARAVERDVRETIQYLDVEKLLIGAPE
ncbi:hypothetical protein [Piscinibacter terrae]|uniref:Uncharacterized protein n=1 Tax=Piscinibacter terrae TaxID=2496871 RepID=A0A3N7JR53_9BURK|nr:hypothetical protein [Albitalea terrae]RQP23489.1 hypothetical protein DZC73_15145 [Albitalea terrae]